MRPLYILRIEKEVIEFYQRHEEEGEYLPSRQTIWPRSKCFRCKLSEEFINEICQLLQNHAEPELMDHLSIYKGGQAILEWHDAFSNAMLLSKSLPEQTVAAFSKELGLKYGRTENWGQITVFVNIRNNCDLTSVLQSLCSSAKSGFVA